jgi:chromosome segregation ATPase
MDVNKQLQTQLNEREAKEKQLAEELAAANEKVQEREAALTALKQANDDAQCENQAHTEQLKQLKQGHTEQLQQLVSEMEKLQKEVPARQRLRLRYKLLTRLTMHPAVPELLVVCDMCGSVFDWSEERARSPTP